MSDVLVAVAYAVVIIALIGLLIGFVEGMMR